MTPIQDVLSRLEKVKSRAGQRRQWDALCPAHQDRQRSLSITADDADVVALHCHAGCSPDAVVEAIGLALRDLRPHDASSSGKSQQSTGVIRWPLYDADGSLAGFHCRQDGGAKGKRMWWEQHGGRSSAKMPLYGLRELLTAPKGACVYVTEGEKAADALTRAGALAVATVTGASGTPCDDALRPLLDYDVVLWPDHDDVGREHMGRLAKRVTALGGKAPKWVRWPDAPAKGDAADYFAAGSTLTALEPLIHATDAPEKAPWRPQVQSLAELMRKQLPDVRWAVKELIGEGLTLLAAKPKKGKTVLMLNIALSVASGAKALGELDTQQGEVLYIALEDNERRMQRRIRAMLGDRPVPQGFYLVYQQWPRLDLGGVEALAAWLDEHPTTRLIVIDTLHHVRAPSKGNGNTYAEDYNAVKSLQQLAGERQVSIVAVHHLRKGGAEDPMDEVSGSTGLTGGSDNILVLRQAQGVTEMHRKGRDYTDDEALALQGDAECLTWSIKGKAEDVRRSKERQAILDVLIAAKEPLKKSEVLARLPGAKANNVGFLLFKMASDGDGGVVYVKDAKAYGISGISDTIPAANAANRPEKPAQTRADQKPISGISGISGSCAQSPTGQHRYGNQRTPKGVHVCIHCQQPKGGAAA